MIGLGRPFPYISNLSLSLGVLLHDPDQDVDVLARVKVPKELLGRFLEVGEGETTLVLLEDLIADNLGVPVPRDGGASTTRSSASPATPTTTSPTRPTT